MRLESESLKCQTSRHSPDRAGLAGQPTGSNPCSPAAPDFPDPCQGPLNSAGSGFKSQGAYQTNQGKRVDRRDLGRSQLARVGLTAPATRRLLRLDLGLIHRCALGSAGKWTTEIIGNRVHSKLLRTQWAFVSKSPNGLTHIPPNWYRSIGRSWNFNPVWAVSRHALCAVLDYQLRYEVCPGVPRHAEVGHFWRWGRCDCERAILSDPRRYRPASELPRLPVEGDRISTRSMSEAPSARCVSASSC